MIEMMIGNDSPLDRLRQRRGGVHTSTSARSRADRVSERRHGRRRAGLSAADEERLQRLLAEPMDFIDSSDFYEPDAEHRIYEEAAEIQKPDVGWYRPLMDDLTPSGGKRQSTKQTGTVLLTAAEERVLFLQYNYSRFRIAELQKEIGADGPTDDQAHELLDWYRTALQYREQIAETNLALVLAMAKRTRMSEVDFADLVSEGNMALLRSVDKFDCGRGFKFSTYACRAILKAFSRQGMKLSKYRQRFPTDFDPALEKSNHLETVRRTHEEECAEEVKHIILNNDAALSSVEQTVIHHRFGLGAEEGTPALTLEQVGQIIGVTKERVRQIQNKALEKVRLFLEENARHPSERDEDEPAISPN